MSNKILIAFAAFAMLSTAAIVATSASAAPLNHPGHGIPGHPGHPGWHPHNWHPHNWHPHNWHPYVVRYRVRTAPVAYVAPAPVAAVAAPCTCLTKEYTPEGAVLFKDICTNEAAINPPAQAPQQTGMLQAQPLQ